MAEALRAAQSMDLAVRVAGILLLKAIIYYRHEFVNDEAVDLIMPVTLFK